MSFLCTRCWNSGVVKEREVISRKELSAVEQAELLVLGGYAYREVLKPCPCGRKPRKRYEPPVVEKNL